MSFFIVIIKKITKNKMIQMSLKTLTIKVFIFILSNYVAKNIMLPRFKKVPVYKETFIFFDNIISIDYNSYFNHSNRLFSLFLLYFLFILIACELIFIASSNFLGFALA